MPNAHLFSKAYWTSHISKSRNTLLFALIPRGSHVYGLRTILQSPKAKGDLRVYLDTAYY